MADDAASSSVDILSHAGALRAAGDLDGALAAFRVAVKNAPQSALAHAGLADLLWQRERYDEAAAHFRAAIAARPDWADPHESLGRILMLNNLPQAEASLREAIRLDPRRLSAYEVLAAVLTRRNKHDEADRALAVVLTQQPRDPLLLSQLAWLRLRAGRYVAASQAANAAIAADASFAYPHALLGHIAQAEGSTADAIQHYRHYLERDPGDREGITLHLAELGATNVPDKLPTGYVQSLYGRQAIRWDRVTRADARYGGHVIVEDAVRRILPRARGLDVMDIGCGTGSCAPFLRRIAKTLDGVDLSPQMLDKARERDAYDSLVEGDIEAVLKARPAQYDLIVGAAILVHFGDLVGPLGAAASALRSRGWMVFTVFPYEGDGYGMLSFGCYGHSRAHIRDRAAAGGFDVVSLAEELHEYHRDRPMNAYVVILRRCA